ncbi:ABC transporter ATP-binding protein [Bacillus atrophaeus]|uniref:ABC transporter ATP-binding protein n=1 Tax=Bacillus atrophaeus TaxID=1452 RepID=UPI00227F9D58|nr:ABC transporter ATP-binding protein [Bacillus atrophaeus]MCY7948726.1 ABC transporter ATP-binding protein [Bacillus atrophaeus]MCY8095690.1 ABC transporter ATP-binding protein [Bacillus atrophaeus]MCY9170457.1 ABC transporter ATP-binding protein [Bacillus atrophaeus]MEC0739487.1 ABC transporter ATP-binding protein [Bacillus atrophaeus]MEC0747835.1 ABC transporter ATP-binding protein [Bacillus atrophaeus]
MISSPIEVKNIKKSLQGREILKGISFNVEKGDIFGFIGPNGAGKTTTIRILLGLYAADEGSASIMGYDVSNDESRKKVGFVIDGDGLYDNMTAEANLGYYLKIYEKPVDKTQIKKVLDLVGLANRAQDKVGTFSKGMRQRLALARALVYKPEVLILDEPTSGIDPSAQLDIRQILLDLVHKENKTVLLSSHNMDEVQKICNRVALLNNGEIKLYGRLDELYRQVGKNIITVHANTLIDDRTKNKLKSMKEFGLSKINEKDLIFTPSGNIKVPDIINMLAKEGVEVERVSKNDASLEDVYNKIVRSDVNQ